MSTHGRTDTEAEPPVLWPPEYIALTYSFPNLEPVCCSMSGPNSFLTCLQVCQKTGKVVWYSHLQEFSTVCCDPHSQSIWHSQ